MRLRPLAIAGLVTLSLATAACGGGDDDDASTESSTTSSSLIEDTTTTVAADTAPVSTDSTVAQDTLTTTTTVDDGRLTRAEYIAAGDALCLRFLEATNALPEPTSVQQLAEQLDLLLPLADEISAELAAMAPPAEAAEVHQMLRSALDQSLVLIREARQAITDGDLVRAQAAITEAADVADDSDDAAKAFGFQVCGSEAELRTS